MTNIRKIQNSVKPLMMLDALSKAPPAGTRHDRPQRKSQACQEGIC